MTSEATRSVVREADGTTTEYDEVPVGGDTVERLMTEIFRDHCYGCFIHDPVGLQLLDFIGVDNVMIETDFPHNSTWWPHSMEKAQEWCQDLPADVRYRVLRGNAERLFQFTPAPAPTRRPPGR